MNRRMVFQWLLGGMAVLLLVACTTTGNNSDSANGAGSDAAQEEASPARLSADYKDALTVQGQLALGTLQLEDTEMALDEAQAAELLPLWQALQSLANSDTAAQVEIDAVINQIQDTMKPDQIQAIADMALTSESITELADSGALGRGAGLRGFFGGADQEGDAGGGFPPGGFPEGAIVVEGSRGGGFRGGGGEGFAGGGPGGGGFIGGPGGFAGGNVDENTLATRQAQFAEDGGFQEQMVTAVVIRLLQTKTGEAPDFGAVNPAGIIFSVVSEATGLSNADIRAQMAEGSTLADVIASNGGDVSEVRAKIIEALNELPNAADLDVDQMADDWLNGTFDQSGG